jgi:hypothetical protein
MQGLGSSGRGERPGIGLGPLRNERLEIRVGYFRRSVGI